MGLPAQRQLLQVFFDPFLDDRFHFFPDRKIPVGGTQTLQALVRTLVVVILDPVGDSFLGTLDGRKFSPDQEFLVDSFPKPLDLAKCLGVVRRTPEMMNPVAAQLFFKSCFTPPARVLPPVVGQ